MCENSILLKTLGEERLYDIEVVRARAMALVNMGLFRWDELLHWKVEDVWDAYEVALEVGINADRT